MVITVCGTRPEAIKLEPVIKGLYALGVPTELWTITQHQKLLYTALRDMDLEPDQEFIFERKTSCLSELIGHIGSQFGPVLKKVDPKLVVVQGDTTSAALAAFIAFNEGIPVAHVEAGIRSHVPSEPFPEEANRRLIDSVSSLRFCPTWGNKSNLLLEGLGKNNPVTGNTVIDALKKTYSSLPPVEMRETYWPNTDQKRILIDLHRREKWSVIPDIFAQINKLATRRPDLFFLVPCHPNKLIGEAARERFVRITGSIKDSVAVVDAMPHKDFVSHMETAHLIVTDSGGAQEEASWLGTPVLVARTALDRLESIATGQAEQVAPHPQAIPWRIEGLIDDRKRLKEMSKSSHAYGDGTAGSQIARLIQEFLGGSS